jgi:hypothetical protein
MEQLRMATLGTCSVPEADCYRVCSIPFKKERTVENMILLLLMECCV